MSEPQQESKNQEETQPTEEKQAEKKVTETKIELKNIQSTALYRLDDQKKPVRVPVLNTNDGTFKMKVTFSDGKTLWLDVKDLVEQNGEFIATAALSDTVQLSDQAYHEGFKMTVPKATVQPSTPIYTSFKSLVEAINNNLSGSYQLGQTVSADEITLKQTDQSYISKDFTGTLIGFGAEPVVIYDLKKPLFSNLQNATVKKLQLKEVNISAAGDTFVGALAKQTNGATVQNIKAQGRVSGEDEVGGIIGRADKNSTLSELSFNGYVASAGVTGGVVGAVTRNSSLTKAYADVTISSSTTFENNVKVGGLVGTIGEDSSVLNGYVTGRLTNNSLGDYVGGIVGYLDDKARLSDVTSDILVSRADALIGGNPAPQQISHIHASTNAPSKLTTVTRVSKEEAKRKQAEFKSLEQPPVSSTSYTDVSGYQPLREKAYHNLEKFLPFYDRKTIVQEGNNLKDTDNLVTKTVATIKATDINHQLVSNLYANKEKVKTLHVSYTDGSTEEMSLSQPTRFQNTAIYTYTVGENRTKFHFHHFIVDNSAFVQQLANDLTSKTLSPDLFNPYNLTLDRYNKRNGIDLGGEKTVTAPEKIKKLNLDPAFESTKTNLLDSLYLLFDYGPSDSNPTDPTIQQQLKDPKNKQALLLGLTYVNRWYNFGNLHRDLLSDLIANGSALSMLQEIGHTSTDALDSRLTQTAYSQLIAPYTQLDTLTELLQQVAKQEDKKVDDWIKEKATAHIYQTELGDTQTKAPVLKRLSKYQNGNLILPLLSGKDDKLYILFTSDSMIIGYSPYKTFSTVEKSADQIQKFFDAIRRIVNEASKERFDRKNIIVYHQLHQQDNNPSFNANFKDPLGLTFALSGQATDGAYAQGDKVYFEVASILTPAGLSTLTHEHTHNIDSAVLLDGHGLRGTHYKENYATGLFQSLGSTTQQPYHGFNWLFDRRNANERTYNAEPERFQNAADLNEYYRGVYDVLYTLDAAEGDYLIRKNDPNYIKAYYSHIRPEVQTKARWDDKVEKITELPPIQSLADLIKAGIVGGTKRTTYHNNGYYWIDLFDAQFGVLENPTGNTGGYTLRRLGFELLAEKGYYEGMVPYISDQYVKDYSKDVTVGKEAPGALSDSYILKKIFNGEYTDFKDFRLKMLERRKTKASHLRPVHVTIALKPTTTGIRFIDQTGPSLATETYTIPGTTKEYTIRRYEDIEQIFNDITTENRQNESNIPNQIKAAKKTIYQAYLQLTNDFRESIYTDQ